MKLGRIDHTAVVVHDLDASIEHYRSLFGVEASGRAVAPDQDVEVAFLAFGDTHLELIQPLSATSGVARYLDRHGESLHHIGVVVEDIQLELDRLASMGVELIDRHARRSAHGAIAFVHPRGTGGILVELIERDKPQPPY